MSARRVYRGQYSEHTEVDSGHGRIETRKCEQLAIDVKWLDKKYRWAGLKSIIKITSQVEDKATSKVTKETRWYITLLPQTLGRHCMRPEAIGRLRVCIGCWI